MRAITVLPGVPNSVRVEDVAEPPIEDGSVLVDAVALGVCGTDREITAGAYGSAPPGARRLVLGHESLGIIREAPPDCGLRPGDLVVGIVRRPDPVPCPACAMGEWDMCRNGEYTERGIKGRNGYASERFRVEPEFTIKLDDSLGFLGVLLEPASILAKAWEHAEYVGRRSRVWAPRSVLVTGAGPIGLLAALLGAQRDLKVHVLDHGSHSKKEELVRALGGSYHAGNLSDIAGLKPDVVMECTGAPEVIAQLAGLTSPAGVACLIGVTTPGHEVSVDIGAANNSLVANNDAIFGSVNANRRHYEAAALALMQADKNWLRRLITRRVPLPRAEEAFERRPGDIKVVIDFRLDHDAQPD
jgi:threonine dehydrogenase-like Zn-dependent dehydrogenase